MQPYDRGFVLALILLAAAVATRAWQFGNPLIHQDEQFYLLVGERLIGGDLPYVAIWDRKPVGLFLLYALLRWIGGPGVLGYQIAATLCAAGTAFVVARIARRFADPAAALCAGLAYLAFLPLLHCSGGQTPVFYNLLVALAAREVLAIAVDGASTRAMASRGTWAMLLLGVAVQIKYTVLFEALALEFMLLWLAYTRDRRQLVLAAALWSTCLLLPTALALGWYWHVGAADAFVQANFISVFQRRSGGIASAASLLRLLRNLALIAPLILAAALAMRARSGARGTASPPERVVRYWTAAAFIGFAVFGTYYIHYTAALLPPLCALAAPALGMATPARRQMTAAVLAVGVVGSALSLAHDIRKRGGAADLAHATAAISPRLGAGCLYVWQGDPALYRATGACLATRFAMPSHLSREKEAGALGVDPATEMRALLSRKPAVIVTNAADPQKNVNRQTHAILFAALARDYVSFDRVAIGQKTYLLYRRR